MHIDAHWNVSAFTFHCGKIEFVQGGSYDQPICGDLDGLNDFVWIVYGVPT